MLVTEPVTSGDGTGNAADAVRRSSRSSVSTILASFADGSSCAFSARSRRSPILLSCVVALRLAVSRPDFSAARSPDSFATLSCSARVSSGTAATTGAAAGLSGIKVTVAAVPARMPSSVASATDAASGENFSQRMLLSDAGGAA